MDYADVFSKEKAEELAPHGPQEHRSQKDVELFRTEAAFQDGHG